MPTEKERQNILKTFFERNSSSIENKSETIRCSEGDFVIIFNPDTEELTIYKNADKAAAADFKPITDDQKDGAITALGKKLIFNAAQADGVEYLEACLNAGASVNDKDLDHEMRPTPLHYAANAGQMEACEFLVKMDADIFATDKGGLTPLQKVIQNIGEEAEVSIFLKKEVKKQSYQHYSDQFNSSGSELLKTFYDVLERDEFVDDYGYRYSIEKEAAAALGQEAKYKFSCIDYEDLPRRELAEPWEIGYALNEIGKQLIPNAVDEGNIELVKACLDVGASANGKTENEIPFIIKAAVLGNLDICRLLIENGANVSKALGNGVDALMHAAFFGHKDVCELLITSGADVFRMYAEGKTAAALATEERGGKDPAVGDAILDLIESKQKKWHEEHSEALENINNPQEILAEFHKTLKTAPAGENKAKTFLHQNGRRYQISEDAKGFVILGENGLKLKEDWEAYYVLRTFGSNLDKSDGAGESFFFKAAKERGNSKFIKACLDSGIPVDEKDKAGKTALFYAREIGDEETITILSAESVKKHKTPSFSEAKRKDILKTFLAAQGSDEDKKSFRIVTDEGDYEVKEILAETGKREIFVDVVKEGETVRLEGAELNCAIGDLGRSLIFKAAKSGNTELYKACIDAGASKDDVDGNGNRPLTYAKKAASKDASKDDVDGPTGTKINSKGGRGISHLIAGITKDPTTEELKKPNKFRELAIKVREKYLANKGGEGAALIAGVQAVIDEFAQRNPGFKLDGLTAKDMIVFMKDISIEGMGVEDEKDRKGVPYLDRKPKPSSGGTDSNLEKLLEGKTLEGEVKADYERRKAFYPELLIDCLEDTHGFLSQNRSDRIRQLIIDNAQKKSSTPRVGKSAGYSALNSVEKDSVADLYMRARFEKLKKREGLKDDLTYEDFSKKLGDVVKINFGIDREERESRKNDLLEERGKLNDEEIAIKKKHSLAAKLFFESLKKKLEEGSEEKAGGEEKVEEAGMELRSGIQNYRRNFRADPNSEETTSSGEELTSALFKKLSTKPLKQNADKIAAIEFALEEISKEKPSVEEHERALICLFGSGDKGEEKNRIAHGDLRIALNIMRADSDFAPAEIIKQRRLERDKAAGKLQKIFRGARSRRNNVDVRDGKVRAVENRVQNILGLELTNEIGSFDKEKGLIPPADYSGFYSKGAIEEVAGTGIYDGNTGLVIHKFSGSAGFRTFTEQVAEANRAEWAADSDKVSIAYIEDMPIESGVKKSFCIAVSSDKGATKIFSKTIPEISKRSEVVYAENLQFVTKRRGIEAAIDVLTEARNGMLPAWFNDKEKTEHGEKLESEFERKRKEIALQIAGLLRCLKDTDVKDDDSLEEIKRKRGKLDFSLDQFYGSKQGEDFLKSLEMDPLFLPLIDPKKVTVIKKLLDGESDKEMRGVACQRTSKQMQTEIAARVKNSKEVNDSILKLDGLEVASVMAKYGSIDAKGREGLKKLLEEEMPASAYEGISVFRPRGKDNIATVTFNGAYKGDDTMYLTLPDSPECYARVFRCDKDGDFSFWENGKKVTKARNKGDIIIDTGVVFHKGSNGKYEPMSLNAAADKFGREVKEAALDFKIKAISVDGGQRLQLATLYNGRAIGSDLAPKTSHIQKVDSHNPLENLESQGVVFDVVKICKRKFQNLDRNRDVKLSENVTLLIGKETDESELVFVNPNTNSVERAINFSDPDFKVALTGELQKLEHSEIAAFAKRKFFKDCSTEDKDEIKRLLSSDDREELAKKMSELIPSICKDRLEKADKKYAAIYSDENLRLFIPVELDGLGHPKFSYPVIQPKNKESWGKSVEIFDAEGKMIPANMDLIKKNFNRDFLRKFFTAEEMEGYSSSQEFLDKPFASDVSNCEVLCERMKTNLKDIKVAVGYQLYENEGFTDAGEEKYKETKKLHTDTFLVNQRTREGKLIEKVQAEKPKSIWENLRSRVSNSSGRAA